MIQTEGIVFEGKCCQYALQIQWKYLQLTVSINCSPHIHTHTRARARAHTHSNKRQSNTDQTELQNTRPATKAWGLSVQFSPPLRLNKHVSWPHRLHSFP